MNNLTRNVIGMDISDRDAKTYGERPDGTKLLETTLPLDRAVLEASLRPYLELDPVVVLEAGTHSNWLSDFLLGMGFRDVLVANPRDLKLISHSKKKNDRIDARKLARIGRVAPELLAAIKPRSAPARLTRSLVGTRAAAVKARTMLVNNVRGTVKAMGGRLADCDPDQFHRHANSLDESLVPFVTPMMNLIECLTETIEYYDEIITDHVAESPAAERLAEVPGIGPITALSFVACVDDPHRFKRNRNIGAYLGLVPGLDESGELRKQLPITKAGDPYMRELLVMTAQRFLMKNGKDCDLKRWGRDLMERGGKNGRKRAVVAVARKLAVMLLTLWKSGQDYRPFTRPAPETGPGEGKAKSAPKTRKQNKPMKKAA